jgi:hypothetical protein
MDRRHARLNRRIRRRARLETCPSESGLILATRRDPRTDGAGCRSGRLRHFQFPQDPGRIPYTYGVTFSGGFKLNGSTGDSGPAIGVPVSSFVPASYNFLNTATITSIVLPAGATLLTGSGTIYPLQTATPVPEPSSLVFVTTGLAYIARRLKKANRGSLTISAVSLARISGSFDFVVVPEGGTAGGNRSIQGTFDVAFHNDTIC